MDLALLNAQAQKERAIQMERKLTIVQRADELKNLYQFVPKTTIHQQVGEEFGISRQRVDAIVKELTKKKRR